MTVFCERCTLPMTAVHDHAWACHDCGIHVTVSRAETVREQLMREWG